MMKLFFIVLGMTLSFFSLEAFYKKSALVPKKSKELEQLKLSMIKMDEELNQKQKLYLEHLQKAKALDEGIETLSKELDHSTKILSQKRVVLQKMWPHYLPESGVMEEDIEIFYEKKVLEKAIVSYLISLKEEMTKNDKKKEELTRLKEELFEYTTTTETIEKSLMELEENRKNILGHYQNALTQEQLSLREDLSQTQKMSWPIEVFIKKEQGKKGMTFTFEKDQLPVKALSFGHIVYVGELSSYGNVIMIDHGGDIRSILLGPFTPKVKKGDRVSAGSLVGVTKLLGKKSGQIYLELRKKNLVQNIAKWVNKGGVSE